MFKANEHSGTRKSIWEGSALEKVGKKASTAGAPRTGREMEQNQAEEVGKGQHSHCLVALGFF